MCIRDRIEAYVANARKAGLMIHACYMVGNQGETHETMKETLAAAMRFKMCIRDSFQAHTAPSFCAKALNSVFVMGVNRMRSPAA